MGEIRDDGKQAKQRALPDRLSLLEGRCLGRVARANIISSIVPPFQPLTVHEGVPADVQTRGSVQVCFEAIQSNALDGYVERVKASVHVCIRHSKTLRATLGCGVARKGGFV